MTTAQAITVERFADQLLGQPLWNHQLDFARSLARYRVMCAGRQVGKSRVLAVTALHEGFTKRNATVLLVSAGETASRRLLEECAAMATASPLLRGSVLDDSKSQITLSNGSRIISVPASQRQIRGWPVDLLIIDEAGFVDPEIWRAAEPSVIARPGSRVILSSSPWGSADHFFRQLWRRGTTSPDDQVQSWHWPSSTSPMVDQQLLAEIQAREPADYFSREYLAEWTDDAGAYFTTAELENAVAGYEYLGPGQLPAGRPTVAGGIDWGMARDANALVMLGVLDDCRENNRDELTYFIPHLEAHYRMPYADFIKRVVEVASRYSTIRLVSETNGVGAYPTESLRSAMNESWQRRQNEWSARDGWIDWTRTMVTGVTTDNRRKATGFGQLKVLLQQGRIVLPRHPELLKQLHALEFEQLTGGQMRIAVPDRAGHDDLAMALMQAISTINPYKPWGDWYGREERFLPSNTEWLSTGNGTKIPVRPQCWPLHEALHRAPGRDKSDGW